MQQLASELNGLQHGAVYEATGAFSLVEAYPAYETSCRQGAHRVDITIVYRGTDSLPPFMDEVEVSSCVITQHITSIPCPKDARLMQEESPTSL